MTVSSEKQTSIFMRREAAGRQRRGENASELSNGHQ